MNMEPEEFVSDILINKLKAKVIVVGTDYCFGRDRSGNVEFLISNAAKYGYETIVVEKEKYICKGRIKVRSYGDSQCAP